MFLGQFYWTSVYAYSTLRGLWPVVFKSRTLRSFGSFVLGLPPLLHFKLKTSWLRPDFQLPLAAYCLIDFRWQRTAYLFRVGVSLSFACIVLLKCSWVASYAYSTLRGLWPVVFMSRKLRSFGSHLFWVLPFTITS